MSAGLDSILVGTHSDEEMLKVFRENEWEPENPYVQAVYEGRYEQVSAPVRPVFRTKYPGLAMTTPLAVYVPARHEVQLGLDAEIRCDESVQAQVIKCIAGRPHESIKLGSKLGIALFLFTLLVYFVGGVLTVNPVVSFFGILACILFWIMAKVDERLTRRRR